MLDQKGLARLRPNDTTASAIRSAIITAKAEREAAQQHLAERQASQQQTLLAGSVAAIRANEDSIRDAEIHLMRLGALIAGLERELAEAVAREAGEVRAQQVRDATEAIEAFNSWLAANYATHAAALAGGLELEQRAWKLREELRDPRSKMMLADLPAITMAHVGSDARSLGFLVRLPAAECGAPPFWWPR